MPVQNDIRTNFTAGELSPNLYGRTDLSKYYNGAAELLNLYAHVQGGVHRRGGSRYISEVFDSSKKVRLIPFEFSVTQAYVLEFGNNYIRFFKDKGQITIAKTITGATKANPCVITATAHGFQNGDKVTIAAVVGMTELNGNTYTVANKAANTFELSGIDSSTFTAYSSGGTATGPYSIVTTYLEAELFEIQVAQSADTMYIAHGEHAPAKLTRSSHTSWTLTTISFTATPAGWGASDYPRAVAFYEQRLWWAGSPDEPQTLWASKTSNYEDMTKAPIADDMALEYTIATDQVNAIRWLSPGKVLAVGTHGGEFIVSASALEEAITPTNVRITRHSTFGSYYTLPIRVADVVLFVQRSQRKLRQFVYQFESDNYISPDLTLLSEHITESGVVSIAYQQETDSIVWLVLTDGTLVGLTYNRDQDVFSWHRHILGGVSDVIGTQTIVESVCSIPGTKVDELWVSVQRYINGAIHRSVEFVEHGLIEDPETIADAFFVDAGTTFDDSVTITGATQANPVVITAAAHGFSDADTVYIEDVYGMTELNKKSFTVANKTTNTFELSGIDGSAYTAFVQGGTAAKEVTVLTGLDHHEGNTLSILKDGSTHADKTVAGGSITLDTAGRKIHVGLGFTSSLTTLRIEAGSRDGSAQGKTKRVSKMVIRFHNTVGARFGPDKNNLEILPFRSTSDLMDQPVPLFNGDKKVNMPGGFNGEGQVVVQQTQPLPLGVTCIIAKVKTNG